MNRNTLLLRQIHPTWIQDERVTSQAFTPTPKDERRLSVYDGDQITAKDAWYHYAPDRGHPSSGVMAVTVAECQEQNLIAMADPLEGFKEHTVIDYGSLTGSAAKNVAKTLTSAARQRGWLYRSDPTGLEP